MSNAQVLVDRYTFPHAFTKAPKTLIPQFDFLTSIQQVTDFLKNEEQTAGMADLLMNSNESGATSGTASGASASDEAGATATWKGVSPW